jgi:hypothetical protein
MEVVTKQEGKMKLKNRLLVAMLCLAAMLIAAPLRAEDEETALAKKIQNPVADLITVPFQNSTNYGYGPHHNVQNVMNIQPVIPIKLNDCYNLITRTIVPVIHQPWPDTRNGIGDIIFSAFLSPRGEGKFIWGVGPVFQLPTGSPKYLLSQGQWGAGPTAVALFMDGPWVVGCLANNIWSFAGDSNRKPVNQMLVQPFINYNFGKGWYAISAPIITANWLAPDKRDVWTLPVGGGFGKLFKLGKLPINATVQAYTNTKQPHVIGPDWTLRTQIQFLFPK